MPVSDTCFVYTMNRISSFRKGKNSTSDAPFQLFVYDSRRGNTESTEKEKLLAFYPTDTNIDEQLSIVGLAQTIALFSATFSGDSNFVTLDTDKRKWASRNFEPGIWVGISVKKNWGPGEAGEGGIKIFLQDLYNYSVLLYGSVQRLLDIDATGRRAKASLQGVVEIWSELLMQKKSEERVKYENPLDLTRHGVLPTLALPRSSFLALQHIINRLCSVDLAPDYSVHRALVCFEHYILWSGLDGKNTRQLYGFVQKNEMLSNGKGLEGGSTLIHLQHEDSTNAYWLVPVYKAPLSIFLVLRSNPQTTLSFESLDQNARELSGVVIQSATRQLSAVKDYHISGYRYVYIDRLAHIGYATPGRKLKTLSSRTIDLLTHVQSKVDEHILAADDEGDFEIVAKRDTSGWIVARKIGSKVLYVAFSGKEDRKLEDVEESTNQLCNKYFPGAFEL